jgi:hypothetical protein
VRTPGDLIDGRYVVRGPLGRGGNESDMRDRGIGEFDLIDVTSHSRDGSRRSVFGYRAVRDALLPGGAAGYIPELNVLCGIADVSTQSEQPVTKHFVVDVRPTAAT